MYTTFFGLRELPFPLANDLHFFYSTPAIQKAGESISAAFRKHTGLVLLTGEPGTGKTMLLRRIISSLDSHISIIVLPFSAVTFDDILTYLCEHFTIITSSNDPFTRVLAIQEHLQTLTEQEMRVVLCIDEAQNLRKETLDRLRLLLHLKGPHGKLLQIFLVGQPSLETKLAHPDLRHVQQYITDHYRLEPLTQDAVPSFIFHRLRIAGCDRIDLFAPEAIERIAYYSQHVPRSINVICDNALIAAYLAGSRTVSLDIVEDVAQNLQLNNSDEAEVRTSEPIEPLAYTPSSQDTQKNPRSSGRQWLYNLAWTGVGLAFAWLSSDPQLSSLARFSLFSADNPVQIETPPASLAITAMSSPMLPHENQSQVAPLRLEQSLPLTEASTAPTNAAPVPPGTKKDKLLSRQYEQSAITEKHHQKSDKDTPQQRALIIKTLSRPALSDSTVSVSPPFGSGLIESPQRQPQTPHLPRDPTFSRRAHEAKTAPSKRGQSPIGETFLRAVATNNVQETRRLLAARVPANAKNERGWTGLMIAARDNRLELVRLLLTHGADVNIKNKEGETALIYAADNDHLAIVQLLLKHGAAIDTKSNLGWTALMYAASKGHRHTVETLLSKGANPNVKDKDGQTAAMYAARQGNVPQLRERLRESSALRYQFGRLDDKRLQLVKRHDYRIIASLLKEAEGKQ